MNPHLSFANTALAGLFAGALAVPMLFVQPAGKPDAPAATPASKAPATQPAADPKKPAEKELTTAEELLTALETADKKIKTISAELNFTTVAGEIEGRDMQRRHGWLYFRNRSDAKTADGKPAPNSHAAAAVKFDTLTQSNKQHPERKTYVVDGSLVIERIEAEKLINRYRIGKADKPQDPLKLGEGPFPLPFGQQKAEVMARFEPGLVPALEGLENIAGALRDRLSPTYQLKLVPKSEAGVSSKVKEVRVWYQKSDLLPVLARIMRPDGGFDEFYLVGIQVNKSLPADVFDTKVPDGWKVEEKERP